MISNITFNFHETFQPQIIYLGELIKLAANNYEGSKEQISDITGIPTGEYTGKVVPHIKYLEYMGVIQYIFKNGKYKLKLTSLGNTIYNEDYYLMQDITKLILSYNLSRIEKGAPQWSYLFRKYPYEFNEKIKLESIEKIAMNEFGKSLELSPLKTMYTNGDFNNVSTIELRDKKSIIFKNVIPMYDAINAYAYCLINEWEDKLSSLSEVPIREIENTIGWSKGLGFDYETCMEILDEINMRGYVKLNKQLNPITIVKNIDSEELLGVLYEDLV